jgi:hypothetical protein
MLLPRKPPKVEVVWDDATTHKGGFPLRDATSLGLTERHTAGYLVSESPEVVRVAQTYDPKDGTVDDVTVIPAPWVRRRKKRK